MQSGFLAAAIVLCTLFLQGPIAHASFPLLADSGRPARGKTPGRVSVCDRTGLEASGRGGFRRRFARIHPEKLLCASNLDSIRLDLFDDLHLSALQTEKRMQSDGFLLWTGGIEGVEGCKFILVVREGSLYASVYLPDSMIQIRPVAEQGAKDSRRYLIRELAYPCGTDPVGGAAGNVGSRPSGAWRMVELVNLERKADGLSALEYDGQLTEAARRHAVDMAGHDLCSHEMSDGEPFFENVFASGYPVSTVGENLAAGIATAEEAFECLLSSPEHRANIMNPDFTQIGVGDAVNAQSGYHYFWAQEFGAAPVRSEQVIRSGSVRPPI